MAMAVKFQIFDDIAAAFCGLLRFEGSANFGGGPAGISRNVFQREQTLRKIDVSKNQQNGVVGM